MWELASSGLTEEWKDVSPNQHRIGEAEHRNNNGLLDTQWDAPQPALTLSIKGQQGQVYSQQRLLLNELRFPSTAP